MDLSYPKRLLLYSLLQQHPAWKQAQLAKATGMSESWVKEGSLENRLLVHEMIGYVLLCTTADKRKTYLFSSSWMSAGHRACVAKMTPMR
jgi:hypothetical protein